MRTASILAGLFGLALAALPAGAAQSEQQPIRIAINAEFGVAGSAQVRDALELVTNYSGLIRNYARPFKPGRHDALTPSAVFMARYGGDGAIERITPVRK